MADEVERRTVWVGGIPPALAEPLDTVLEAMGRGTIQAPLSVLCVE